MQQSPSWEANHLQLVKKFAAFYGTRMSITAFTSARHLSLSWANSIRSIPQHPTSWTCILILSSHLRLGLPSDLLPSVFPTKTLYTPPFSTIRATFPAHLFFSQRVLTLCNKPRNPHQCKLSYAVHQHVLVAWATNIRESHKNTNCR